MPRWERTLGEMMTNPRPVNYRYQDAAAVLDGLGFVCTRGDGSHRIWKLRRPEGTIKVMLVDSGHGPLPPGYIRRMLQVLHAANLFPTPNS